LANRVLGGLTAELSPSRFGKAPNEAAGQANQSPPAGAMSPQFATPADARDAASQWNAKLEELISLAAAEASRLNPGGTDEEKREYVKKQVHLRMLYVMAGRPERAFEPIYGIDSADQEFWTQLFWGMANYFDSDIRDPEERGTLAISQLRKAVESLQARAKLELKNVNFCHKIDSFGSYEKFPRDEFTVGQPVLLYAEVGNFTSEPTSDGRFRTLLRSTVEVYKAAPTNGGLVPSAASAGELVERLTFEPTQDLCRNYRRDYFHSYEFTIPPRTAPGPHVLKITVEDQLSRKSATYTLNFTVK
jgi:hypothetical protein